MSDQKAHNLWLIILTIVNGYLANGKFNQRIQCGIICPVIIYAKAKKAILVNSLYCIDRFT